MAAALCRTKSCENALQRRIRTCGSPMEERFPPDMQDPANVAVRLDLCKMDASWNSVPDANVRRSPSCVRASCISSPAMGARWRYAMPDRLNRLPVAKPTLFAKVRAEKKSPVPVYAYSP
ncbi:hypothetical protein CFAM422_010609 [Trichoderma lentiforme]|uniref:Uncharacterized protein n=1 Tax=Trichoderma lentiforme TaxID=1567552 RepID=A0A9P4X854_9HYPO|nr:hypothetical protein CFAM422_010609 [Trichoderma lentiforme]